MKFYLESIHCMYEVASVFKKGGEMPNRLFFVGLENVQSENELRKYWSEKLKETEAELAAAKIALEPIEKRLDQINLICSYLGEFIVYWDDRNRLNFSKVSENNFRVVVNRLYNRINEAEIPKGGLLDNIE